MTNIDTKKIPEHGWAYEPGDNPDGDWHFGYCRMCMRGDCALKYRLKDGRLVEVKGNPHSMTNRGALCPRGQSHIQHTYNPDRVKTPMKRTNPRKGLNEDPGWVEISWEEALDLVATKFTEIQKSDPRKLAINTGFGGIELFVSYGPFLPMVFGTPNLLQSNGPLCSVHYATSLVQGSFPTPAADYSLCDYLITIGRSAGPNNGYANGDARAVIEAVERGMHMVVVDPRSSTEASLGEWVPIRPGTDLAFVLGLIHVVLYEVKTFDVEFLTNRTNGVYLIETNGSYFRSANGKPQVLDQDGTIREFDDSNLISPQLDASVVVDGKSLHTGFSLMAASMKQYTPEWAEEKSTVSAAKIRQIANDFVRYARIGETIKINDAVLPFRPVAIIPERGSINHQDGTVLDLATKILNELVGALEVPGSCLGCQAGPVLKPDADGTVTPVHEAIGVPFTYPPQQIDLGEYFPHRHSMSPLAYKVIQNPRAYGIDYDIEGALICGGNSIVGSTDPEMVAAGLASIPFVATIAYHFDEISMLSDVLLPESSQMERCVVNVYESSYSGFGKDTLGLKQVMFRDPMPTIHNTRMSQDIVFQILERMGKLPALLGVFNHVGVLLGEMTLVQLPEDKKLDVTASYTWEQVLDQALSAYTNGKGIDWFRQNGLHISYLPREQSYNYWYYPGNATRHPLYFEKLRASGESLRQNMAANNVELPGYDYQSMGQYFEPIPRWHDTHLFTSHPEGFDLLAINYKVTSANLRCGGLDTLPWLQKINDLDPYINGVCLNPKTAGRLGVTDGQKVKVESQWGSLEARVVVSNLFHPDAAGFAGALGRRTSRLGAKAQAQVNFNSLMTFALSTIDPVAGGAENTVRVRITPLSAS